MTERIHDFNSRVNAAHNAHIVNGECTLIDVSPNASPNANQIYHLYNDGTVTFQKGAYAYLRRSEFTNQCSVTGYNTIFKFPIETRDGLMTYAVLTKEQCIQFRTEMKEYINDFLHK
jgi:hypothetical protein